MAHTELTVRDVAPRGNWDSQADTWFRRLGLGSPLIFWPVLLLCLIATYAVVCTPLDVLWQTLFGLVCLVAAIFLNRVQGRWVSMVLMVVSTLLSARYMYWRVTESVDFSGQDIRFVDVFFSSGLIAAELYAFLVLILGYMQTLWPLQRTPVAMPADVSKWPSVDVMIPTYNEPLNVLRPTIIAALDMDWPRDRFKVMVLDDGNRGAVAALCEELGATYVNRPDHRHAKAGNVNHALTLARGEYVAVFDCDHVPTRSFLQVSLGWFLKDRKLSMLQTPHHFFSPDPFERNLGTFKQIPNENELFYGLLQDGNDLWNSTFFCGSCAVLRRSALDEIDGLAVETVTEDAHTSLRMQRRGWNTAYINLPQAAGRATESLAGHIRQRMRWARGMVQIFRIDNPLLGRGLTLSQRLCYLNSMLYFLLGMPRIVFLTAPVAFLLFDIKIVQTTALIFVAYALPHLVHAQMTHSRLQGPYRYSFWAEIYETILCVYIFIPTLLALINPKLGKFDVTDKGTTRDHTAFDGRIARPYVVLLALNVFCALIAIVKILFDDGVRVDSVVLNLFWTAYNIIILAVCTAVAWEQREIRRSVRVNAALPARVILPGGKESMATTIDLSEGGTMLRMNETASLPIGTQVRVALIPDFDLVWTDAVVTRSEGQVLAMQFEDLNLAQERQLIYAIFGRADAWIHWAERRPPDKVRSSFGKIFALGFLGARKAIKPR